MFLQTYREKYGMRSFCKTGKPKQTLTVCSPGSKRMAKLTPKTPQNFPETSQKPPKNLPRTMATPRLLRVVIVGGPKAFPEPPKMPSLNGPGGLPKPFQSLPSTAQNQQSHEAAGFLAENPKKLSQQPSKMAPTPPNILPNACSPSA